MTVRVAIDALGGDRGPDEVVQGALAAASDTVVPVIFGPAGLDTHGLELVATTDEIEMHEKPAEAVRGKPGASLVRAVRAVADGQVDAVVSAGSTGAMLAASLLYIRRLPGVHRPGIAVVIPSRRGPTVLIDAGANADARPEHLVQFAHMGVVFAREILGVERPRVGLLSIGEEPEKGNALTLEAHALLAAAGHDFRGNVEPKTLLRGEVDVLVADGFSGNVTLKTLEGAILGTVDALRHELLVDARGKLAGLLMRPAARRVKARLDPEATGGGYLLGLNGLVVIAHGSSSRVAIANAVRMAARGVEHDVTAVLARLLPARV